MTDTNHSAARKESPACPFCQSTETEMMALFGSQLLTSQYYCNGCHTVFEVVRHQAASAGAGEGAGTVESDA